VEATRPRGRPKKTWREIVEKYCQVRGLNREDAMYHSMKQIGMIDNHDECKWVNVSSGTGSPELSWTKSIEPKNGSVCVCVSGPGLVTMQHTTSHTTAVQYSCLYQ